MNNIRVSWWQLSVDKKNPLQLTNPPMLRCYKSAEVQTYLDECCQSTTEDQEAQELLVEIQKQPGEFVEGPAVAITNVGTVSGFFADGRSTETVRRVVRAARRTRIMHLHTRRDDDFRHLSSHSSGTR